MTCPGHNNNDAEDGAELKIDEAGSESRQGLDNSQRGSIDVEISRLEKRLGNLESIASAVELKLDMVLSQLSLLNK
jgi:hypothetical protein